MDIHSGLQGIDPAKLARVTRFLPFCESLGDNCEFGFFMRQLGYDKGGFFRWTVTPFKSLVAYIAQPGMPIYEFDDLVPMSATMVSDSATGFGYHTEMLSVLNEGAFQFVDAESVRREIHEKELAKLTYLADSFAQRLQVGGCVFVVKRNVNLTEEEVARLVLAFDQHPGFACAKLLVLRETADAMLAGSIACGAHNLIEGWVSRFAPYSMANDIAYSDWISVLDQVADAFERTQNSASGLQAA